MGRPRKVVVLVDADPVQLSTLSFVLDTRGFRVLAFDAAREAAEAIAASPKPYRRGRSVDVVVSEAMLAGDAHGGWLTRAVRDADCKVPILLYSRSSADAVSWAIKDDAHATMFLPKSLAVPALIVDRIRLLTARKRGPKPVRRDGASLAVDDVRRAG